MAKLGTATVFISGNLEGLNKALGDAERGMKRTMGNVLNLASKVGAGMTAIGGAITGSIGIMAKFGMEAVESENLFEVSLGGMAKVARAWSDDLSKSLGLNAYEIRKNVGTFNAMLKGMGLGEQAALDMAKGMTQLSYDMASFYNLKPEEAFDKLRSGISGEAEPLKQLGILISDNAVKAYALANGIGAASKATDEDARKVQIAAIAYQQQVKAIASSKKSTDEKRLSMEKLNLQYENTLTKLNAQKTELTDQDKAMARYGLILKNTSLAQGDMARTIESPTNRMRAMRSQIEMVATTIGQFFIPAISGVLNYVKPLIDRFSQWIENNKELASKVALAVGALGLIMVTVGPILMALPAIIAGFSAVGVAIGALFLPIAIIIAAAGLLYLAFKNHFGAIKDFAVSAWTTIKDWALSTFEAIKGAVLGWVEENKAKITELVEHIKSVAMPIWNELKDTIVSVWNEVAPIVGQAIKVIWKFLSDGVSGWLLLINYYWDEIVAVVSTSWETIKDIVRVAWAIVGNLIKAGLDFLSGDWGAAWGHIKDIFSGIWDAIGDKLKFWIDKIKSMWSEFVQWLADKVKSVPGVGLALKAYDAMSAGAGWVGEQFAAGGVMPYSGMALVGERGPEPVFLPRGSRVLSNQEARSVLAGAGAGSTSNSISVTINTTGGVSEADAERVARKIGDMIRRRRP